MKRLLIATSTILLSIIYYFYSIELEKKAFIQNINDQRIEKNEGGIMRVGFRVGASATGGMKGTSDKF